MVEVLALVLHQDEQAFQAAVELALENGVPSKAHIVNHLHGLRDGKALVPPAVRAPHALVLTREPIADAGRYDNLRQDGENRHAS